MTLSKAFAAAVVIATATISYVLLMHNITAEHKPQSVEPYSKMVMGLGEFTAVPLFAWEDLVSTTTTHLATYTVAP